MKRHRLLLATVALLPVTFVPHEVLRSGPSTTFLLLAMILAVGVRYRLFYSEATRVERWLFILIAYVAARLIVGAVLDGPSVGTALVFAGRQIGQLVAGLVMLRAARKPELQPTVIQGLRVGLTGMLMVEVYQLVSGLDRLKALKYLSPEFNYFTLEGTYRPFGTFNGPTVFAGYLAMVGVVVVVSMHGSLTRALAFAAITGGLLLTDTRAAWVSFAMAIAVTMLSHSSSARRAARRAVVPVVIAALVLVSLSPALLASPLSRLATISDSSYESNSLRVDLWRGTLEAISDRPLGYGANSFEDALTPRLGVPIAKLGHAHSTFLQVLYLYGIPGLALFIGLLHAAWRVVSRSSSRFGAAAYAGLAGYVVDAMFENTWTSLNFTATLFLVIGLGVSRRVPTVPKVVLNAP